MPAASVHVTGPPLNVLNSASDLRRYVDAVAAAPGTPRTDGHALYLIYLPPGVAYV